MCCGSLWFRRANFVSLSKKCCCLLVLVGVGGRSSKVDGFSTIASDRLIKITKSCYQSTLSLPQGSLPLSSFSSRLFLSSSSNNNNNNKKNKSISSWIGDMALNLVGGASSSGQTQVDYSDDILKAIDSWEAIRSKWSETCTTDDERQFRAKVQSGTIASPLNSIRLFGSDTISDIRVQFYRDSASWCPYCQKVWIALEEKQISYSVTKINMNCYGDKPREFYQLQPNGQIPVATIDGKTYGQSNDILQALEDAFPNTKKLVPNDNTQRGSELLRLERQLFSVWLQWLGGSGASMNPKQRFIDTLNVVEQELKQSSGPFFMGNTISIVDIQFSSFLERMAASMLYFKGFQIRFAPGVQNDYPAINAWFDAMEKLPSYRLTKSDYYTHCWDLPPQLGGCGMEAAGKPYAAIINGEKSALDPSRGSWELPLELHNGGIEPDWVWAFGEDGGGKREVVERLTGNYEKIIQFAARGAGTKGFPPVAAPLADPRAQPSTNPSTLQAISFCLQVICMKLLDTDEQNQQQYETTMKGIARASSSLSNDVINCLSYLRDRTGVPRDMRLPAARQLRAHLNWSIRILLDEQKR